MADWIKQPPHPTYATPDEMFQWFMHVYEALVASFDIEGEVTAQWTFTEHPLGLDHTKIANIGTKTHPVIDTHIDDDSIHMTDAEAAVIAEAAVSAHELEIDPHTQYQKESEKGVANGYASLASDVKVPVAQLRNPVYIGTSAPNPTEYPLWLDTS